MKIGTLSFHITSNYGALLQLYALQKVLNQLGHESKIINYQSPGSEDHLCIKLNDCKSFQRKLKLVKDLMLCLLGPVGYGKQLKVLRSIEFIKTYLQISCSIIISYQDLSKLASHYDAYIVGSDQVWNPTLKETSEGAYFLEFVPAGRIKISYAASFGVPRLSPEQSQAYGRALRQFDYISVREQEGVQIVKESTRGRDACLVLDPTMLLSRDDWFSLAVHYKKYKEYILCYFLDEFEDSLQFVLRLQARFGLPVLYIGFNKKYIFNPKIKLISGAGPREFLGLFANASLVVTNSFHGTVFSILFRKSFYTILGVNPYRKAMNGRLTNLANMFNLSERIGDANTIIPNEQTIDFDRVDDILKSERNKSLNFLINSLRHEI